MFQKTVAQRHKSITDTISRYFTPVLLLIAFLWHLVIDFIDTNTAFNVLRQSVMSVLVLCNCSIYDGMSCVSLVNRNFLKNALVIEQLAKVDTIVLIKQER
jgi:Cu+-exporting ATPase